MKCDNKDCSLYNNSGSNCILYSRDDLYRCKVFTPLCKENRFDVERRPQPDRGGIR